MAMTGAGLSAAIKANLDARAWFNGTPTIRQQFCDDLGNAIVAYIAANAAVTGLASAVTAGAATAPVTGTVA